MTLHTEMPRAHYIAGELCPGAESFEVMNPLNDALVALVAAGDRAEADAAVAAAHAAFPAWAAMSPGERQRLFLKAAEITERRDDEIVHLLAVEDFTEIRLATMTHGAGTYPF